MGALEGTTKKAEFGYYWDKYILGKKDVAMLPKYANRCFKNSYIDL